MRLGTRRPAPSKLSRRVSLALALSLGCAVVSSRTNDHGPQSCVGTYAELLKQSVSVHGCPTLSSAVVTKLVTSTDVVVQVTLHGAVE
jgi:hypothetical protein